MHNENRFLDTFRGHNIRPSTVVYVMGIGQNVVDIAIQSMEIVTDD